MCVGEVCCALTEGVYGVCVCVLSSQDCNKVLLININVCIMCYAKLMYSVALLLTNVQFEDKASCGPETPFLFICNLCDVCFVCPKM